jgi:hypothetical protein
LIYAAGLFFYAETRAFTWDESYHLVAAQLILAGRQPYLDFCFPQSPLNAYWNALWMAAFGQTWRVAHVAATLLTIAAVLLTARHVARRFPATEWRFPAAVAAGAMLGLNSLVFRYAPVAQPYAMCLFTLTLAFCCCVRSPDRIGALAAFGAGLFAGAAAASSLLAAIATPVLLVWMLAHNRVGSRSGKTAAFLAGAAIPFLPVLRLFYQGPRQTVFNLFQYHVFYRKLYWAEPTQHDIEILTSWTVSAPALALVALGVFGLWTAMRQRGWPEALRSELALCAWLAVALAAESALAHPTFAQYFLLTVPFMAILGAAGLCAAGSRLVSSGQERILVRIAIPILALWLCRNLYDHREDANWSVYQRIASKIEQVTPPGALTFANEPIYFLMRRAPPPGFELYYTHKLQLPAADRALFHILTEDELRDELASGRFASAYSCETEADFGAARLYRQHETIEDCEVYWDFKGERPQAGK